MTTSEKLAAIFEADRDAADYGERFPMYGFVHSEIGCKPWQPPAEDVWRTQGTPASYDDPQSVAEVWSLLSELHADYVAANG